jgi:4-hydroxybutyrate dehydrogenase
MGRAPTFSYLNDVYLGAGVRDVLPSLLESHGISRALCITDAHLASIGLLDRLTIRFAEVFDQVETNPVEQSVMAALDLYQTANCNGLVAVGGGSPIDLAKCVSLLIHHPPPLAQYAVPAGGRSQITAKMPPLIVVPTTAGSGSEVGRAALLTLVSGDKVGFVSRHLLPRAAVCDPELTASMPRHLTAGTGMDAMSHCIETYCSPRINPVADALALNGLARCYFHLKEACANGQNPAARWEMMVASLHGGLAFQKGLGAVHSLSHPLGGLTDARLHHGTLNALFLPKVLRFNYDHCAEKMNVMARCIGVSRGLDFPDAIEAFNEDLGLPARLREMGVRLEDLAPLAEKALRDHCTPTNPRPLDLELCSKLYEESW